MAMSRRPAVDSELFRAALALFPAGVTVVSAATPAGPYGTTVTAFSALSLDPPMVLAAFGKMSRVLSFIRDQGRFGVSFLDAGQIEVAHHLASAGDKRCEAFDWESVDDVPTLAGARVRLVADVCDVLPGGDHLVVYGRVTAGRLSGQGRPLVYYDRSFVSAA
jgi:3-hydroxy-9,10-secoandrosta-1,3,5(10)-triene-9,17-dione monooxygenase reductase component